MNRETNRFWWNRFGPIFAAGIRKKRKDRMRALLGWRWHLDEVFVKINGRTPLPVACRGPGSSQRPLSSVQLEAYPSLTSGTVC